MGIGGANIGAGGLPPVRHPFLFLSSPCRIRTELHEFGKNVVKYCVLLQVRHDFCQEWVQRLREFRKVVVNSVLGMSQKLGWNGGVGT